MKPDGSSIAAAAAAGRCRAVARRCRRSHVVHEAAILIGAATSCDARQRGAKGDGKADDAKHLRAALDDLRCDTVVLTANHTFLSSAMHVQRSGVTLTIEGGAMLAGKDRAIQQCGIRSLPQVSVDAFASTPSTAPSIGTGRRPSTL